MARRQADDQFADEDALTRMDDEGFSDGESADTIMPRIEARRAKRSLDDRLTANNGMALEDAVAGMARDAAARRAAEADRIRMQRALIGAAAAAGAGGVYAQTQDERAIATAPAEPPEQVPDRPAETQVGLPDDGPDLTEDVSIGAPPPPGRRLPPGYRAPQAARHQAPQEEELVLANPNRDDLVLPDPHAGRDLFLPDPNAGRVSMGPERATNSDDPRAKLSRLMKALGR
jgi:hypothetical protein